MGVAAMIAKPAAMSRHHPVDRDTILVAFIQAGAAGMLVRTWMTAAAIPSANQSRKPGSQ